MARTFGALLFYNASQVLNVGAAIALAGDVTTGLTLAIPTNATTKVVAGVADFKRPYISFPGFPGQGTVLTSNENQELFGTAAGGPANPFSGGATASQFGTPPLPWGVSIIDAFVVYNVATLAATSVTLSIERAVYANNVATVFTSLATSAAGPTATQANPYVFKVSVAQPLQYEISDLSDVAAQVTFVLPNTSTASLFGIGFHCAVEFS